MHALGQVILGAVGILAALVFLVCVWAILVTAPARKARRARR